MTGPSDRPAIVLFAHGSRDPQWAAPLQALQAAVLASAAANRVFEYRRVLPGMTWLSEELGQRARVGFIRRGMADTGGDRSYRRHDGLAAIGRLSGLDDSAAHVERARQRGWPAIRFLDEKDVVRALSDLCQRAPSRG